jgi:hypothetical protein
VDSQREDVMAVYRLNCNGVVIRTIDNAFIPPDPLNVDRQIYLSWYADGNRPDPADPAEIAFPYQADVE